MAQANPIVSIIVIAYNSSNYIFDTLQSAYNQTYENIELIISDDFSSDDTLALCEKWLSENKQRFVSTSVVKSSKNTGIPSNCNRGIKMAKGEWIKLIAGDDMLLNDCIEKNINFFNNNQDVKIILSDLIPFLDDTNPREMLEVLKVDWRGLNPKSAYEQYNLLLKSYCGNTPTFFIAKSVFDNFLFDETFFYLEDYPFVLNATKMGYFIYYMPEQTILYRVRNDSVYFSGNNNMIFSDFYQKKQLFDEIYRYPFISKTRRNRELFDYKRLKVLDRLNLNKKSKLNNFIFAFSRYLNPFKYVMSLNKNL